MLLQAHDSSLRLKDFSPVCCHQQSCELRVPVWGTLRPSAHDILHGDNVLDVQSHDQSFWPPVYHHEARGWQAQPSLDKPSVKDRSQGPQERNQLRHIRVRHAPVLYDDPVSCQEPQVIFSLQKLFPYDNFIERESVMDLSPRSSVSIFLMLSCGAVFFAHACAPFCRRMSPIK